VLNTEFSPWPSFSEEEAAAVAVVLTSNKVNYWTGIECREFEKEFAQWSGCEHAVAVANGTLALELGLKALGVGSGDEVIVPPRTFLATASAVVAVGATPVFADVELGTQNISPNSIKTALTTKTKAIVCVHLAGMPCDMNAIMAIAGENDIYVVEDCAQAHGATYEGRPIGSIGHVAAWSFCQDKIMTTGGEGGMMTTNDKSVWGRAWAYKDHGKSYEAVYEAQHPPGFRWLHESFGSNYRMTEMQAAIGRIQLRRMPSWTLARAANSSAIARTCRKFTAFSVLDVPENVTHAYYKFYAFIRPEELADGWSRDRIIHEIMERGVPCYQGSCSEIYLEKAFCGHESKPSAPLPNAVKLGETSIMFLVHPTLTKVEINKTCDVITSVATKAFK